MKEKDHALYTHRQLSVFEFRKIQHTKRKKIYVVIIQYRETIQEDESGRLEPSVTEIIQRTKRRKLLDREASVRLGIMRHVYIILDYSQAMTEQDLKPTRHICTLKV